jgi:hypothetical protein
MNNQEQEKPSRPQNAKSNKFEEVNPRHDDMGFADENQEAAAADNNPVHYSHAANTGPGNGQNLAYGAAIPENNPVEPDTTEDDRENRNQGQTSRS